MIPLHFGSSDARLYGVYHPAVEPRKRKGALILNPWGWEALRAHRTLKTLADRLSAAGYDAFRFDYSCSGDSAGEHEDARLGTWLQDAEAALAEVMAAASVRRVSVFGLRLGSLLAALLAEKRSRDVDRLVLWEPPSSGRQFLRWTEEAPPAETSAFPVPARFREEVGEIQLAPTLSNFRGHVLTVSEHRVSLGELAARSVDRIEPAPGTASCWVEDLQHGAGAVPVALLDRIVGAVQ